VKRAFEPEKAAAWLDQNRDEPWVAEGGFLQSTAQSFAERDPVNAMEWAGRSGNDSAVISAMHTWCQRDEAAAGQWILNNPGSPAYATSVHAFASHLWRRDQAAARIWAEGITDKALRAAVLETIPEGVTPGG
jgi:hypothetical protein